MAFTSLTIKSVGDLLPVWVDLDDRTEARADLVNCRDPFKMHLSQLPYGELAAVKSLRQIGCGGVGQLRLRRQLQLARHDWK
jgi:hypothetical protein